MQSTLNGWGVFGATILAGTLLYWVNRKAAGKRS